MARTRKKAAAPKDANVVVRTPPDPDAPFTERLAALGLRSLTPPRMLRPITSQNVTAAFATRVVVEASTPHDVLALQLRHVTVTGGTIFINEYTWPTLGNPNDLYQLPNAQFDPEDLVYNQKPIPPNTMTAGNEYQLVFFENGTELYSVLIAAV